MGTKKYYHVRIDFSQSNLFDKPNFEIDDNFENYRSKNYKDTGSVPYDLINNPSILNEENGFLKFLDDIVESDKVIDFNDPELRKKILATINFNCYFLNARYWENIFEEIRIQNFQTLPSRKKCIYICEGIDELSFWIDKLTTQSKAKEYKIYEIEIEEQNIFKCDAKILELGIMSDKSIKEEAYKYWSGIKTENPEIENLYFGPVRIQQEYRTIEEIK